MKKKFRRFTFVHVCKEMPEYMDHFKSDFDAIVGDCLLSTLRQDGSRIFEYSLYEIKNNEVVDELAWYHEYQLTALEKQDKEKAEDMIDKYLE